MKLASNFKNDSNGGLSNQLKTFLEQSLDGVNALVKGLKSPVAVVVREDGNTAFSAADLHAHLHTFGVSGEHYRTAMAKPEDGHMRLIYQCALGNGAVDVLIEDSEPIAE